MEDTLILYRAIYTDDYHAKILRERGFEDKWSSHPGKYLISKNDVDNCLCKSEIKLKEVYEVNNQSGRKHYPTCIYATGTYRDACYYALRYINGSDFAKTPTRLKEPYHGEKKPYIISFKTVLSDVYIDPNDSVFPFFFRCDNWSEIQYKQLCKVFGKNIVDKYRKLIMLNKHDTNALAYLMSSENEAIMNFYRNTEVLIHGKHEIELFSSFAVYSMIYADQIISFDEVTKDKCQEELFRFIPNDELYLHQYEN